VKRQSALVVDHDLSTGEFICGLLEERGYRTTVATTYADGLSLFEATSPQLLVIDPRLSDGDGLALVRIAMPSARVVLTSAFPSGVANVAARLGAPLVVKPFDAERFLAQVN
jgi:two-component system OmpR family response regulator